MVQSYYLLHQNTESGVCFLCWHRRPASCWAKHRRAPHNLAKSMFNTGMWLIPQLQTQEVFAPVIKVSHCSHSWSDMNGLPQNEWFPMAPCPICQAEVKVVAIMVQATLWTACNYTVLWTDVIVMNQQNILNKYEELSLLPAALEMLTLSPSFSVIKVQKCIISITYKLHVSFSLEKKSR